MRIQRIETLIKHEVSSILLHDISDPRLGFITITKVAVSRDVKFADVYYSVFGSREERKKSDKGLESATGFIKKIISRKLELRFTPQIIFLLDDLIDEERKVDRLLQDLKKESG